MDEDFPAYDWETPPPPYELDVPTESTPAEKEAEITRFEDAAGFWVVVRGIKWRPEPSDLAPRTAPLPRHWVVPLDKPRNEDEQEEASLHLFEYVVGQVCDHFHADLDHLESVEFVLGDRPEVDPEWIRP